MMKNKPDKELEIIARDRAFYKSEKRYEALKELEQRGLLTPELIEMKKSIEYSEQIEHDNAKYDKYSFFKKDDNIVSDPSVPILFSHKTIFIFSILFSLPLGSFLLMLNLFRLNKKVIGLMALFSGVSFLILLSFLLNKLQNETRSLGVLLNAGGTILVVEYFWNKYIGNELKYRNRNILIPLIIGILLLGIFILNLL